MSDQRQPVAASEQLSVLQPEDRLQTRHTMVDAANWPVRLLAAPRRQVLATLGSPV